MAAERIEVDYELLDQIVRLFNACYNEWLSVLTPLRDQFKEMDSFWRGVGANEFASEMSGKFLPRSSKLLDAWDESASAIGRIHQAMMTHEDDAASAMLRQMSEALGRLAKVFGINPEAFGGISPLDDEFWRQGLIQGKPMWKFIGDMTDLVPGAGLLKLLGLSTATLPEGVSQIAAIAGLIGTGATYLENFGEEPYAARGLSIALLDEFGVSALIDTTGVGAIAQWGNAVIQVEGTLWAAETWAQSEQIRALDPKLADGMVTSATNWYAALDQGDMGNPRWNLSRALFSTGYTVLDGMLELNMNNDTMRSLGLAPEQNDPSRDWQRFGESLTTWGEGFFWKMPNAGVDMLAANWLGDATEVVNANTWIPQEYRTTFTEWSGNALNYMNRTDLVENVVDVTKGTYNSFVDGGRYVFNDLLPRWN